MVGRHEEYSGMRGQERLTALFWTRLQYTVSCSSVRRLQHTPCSHDDECACRWILVSLVSHVSPLHRRRRVFACQLNHLLHRVNSPLSTSVCCGRPDDRSCCPHTTRWHLALYSKLLYSAISILYLSVRCTVYGTASSRWPFLHIELHTTSPTDPWTAIIYILSHPIPVRWTLPSASSSFVVAMAITLAPVAHLPALGWLWLPPWQSHHLASAA